MSREVDSSQKFDSKSVSVENRPQGASQAKSLKRTRSISQPEETLSGSRRTKVPRTTSVHPESVSTQLSASYLLASMRNTLLKETKSALLQQMQTSLGEFIVSEQDHFDQLIEEMKGITNNPEVIDTLKSRYRGTGKRFRAYVQTTERLIDRLKDF